MKIFNKPRRIYYIKQNNVFILDTGEAQGTVDVTTTIEQDFEIYAELKKYSKDAVGCVQLEFGQYKEEFANALPFKINVETNSLEFDYSPLKNEIENKINTYQQEIAALQEKLASLNNINE